MGNCTAGSNPALSAKDCNNRIISTLQAGRRLANIFPVADVFPLFSFSCSFLAAQRKFALQFVKADNTRPFLTFLVKIEVLQIPLRFSNPVENPSAIAG